MQELIGKKVEVQTPDTLYKGILIQIGENELHLQSETGWIIVSIDRIVEIKAAG